MLLRSFNSIPAVFFFYFALLGSLLSARAGGGGGGGGRCNKCSGGGGGGATETIVRAVAFGIILTLVLVLSELIAKLDLDGSSGHRTIAWTMAVAGSLFAVYHAGG